MYRQLRQKVLNCITSNVDEAYMDHKACQLQKFLCCSAQNKNKKDHVLSLNFPRLHNSPKSPFNSGKIVRLFLLQTNIDEGLINYHLHFITRPPRKLSTCPHYQKR